MSESSAAFDSFVGPVLPVNVVEFATHSEEKEEEVAVVASQQQHAETTGFVARGP